jgi:hypothetical protein
LFIEVAFWDAKLSAELSMQFESEPSFFYRRHRFEAMSPPTRGVLHTWKLKIFPDEKPASDPDKQAQS